MRLVRCLAALLLATTLGLTACSDDTPAGPDLKTTLDAKLTRTPTRLTWTYTLRNDESSPIVVVNGPLADQPDAGPQVWITGRDDDTVEVAYRLLAPPEGVSVARPIDQAGTVVAPGATITGKAEVALPLEVRHPYAGAFDPPMKLPDDPQNLIFCVGVALASEVPPQPQPSSTAGAVYAHTSSAAAHQHLACTDPATVTGRPMGS
jgi:hypothetical protein